MKLSIMLFGMILFAGILYCFDRILTPGKETVKGKLIVKIGVSMQRLLSILLLICIFLSFDALLSIPAWIKNNHWQTLIGWSFFVLITAILIYQKVHLRYFKIIVLDTDTFLICKFHKEIPFSKKEITWKTSDNLKLKLYCADGKKLASITNVYDNFQAFRKWLLAEPK